MRVGCEYDIRAHIGSALRHFELMAVRLALVLVSPMEITDHYVGAGAAGIVYVFLYLVVVSSFKLIVVK